MPWKCGLFCCPVRACPLTPPFPDSPSLPAAQGPLKVTSTTVILTSDSGLPFSRLLLGSAPQVGCTGQPGATALDIESVLPPFRYSTLLSLSPTLVEPVSASQERDRRRRLLPGACCSLTPRRGLHGLPLGATTLLHASAKHKSGIARPTGSQSREGPDLEIVGAYADLTVAFSLFMQMKMCPLSTAWRSRFSPWRKCSFSGA